MKVHDAEIESKESLKEAFLQKETIKIGNILYVSEHHSPETPRDLDVCQLCRFYRIKGMLKSAIANKVCSACGFADIEINCFDREPDLGKRAQIEIKLHYLQTIT